MRAKDILVMDTQRKKAMFYCTDFKKHHGFLLNENKKKVTFSKFFFYLPYLPWLEK